MSLSGKTDEQLAQLVADTALDAGARPPFEELYRRHGEMVERFIAARTAAQNVEEIHQETWLRAWRSAGSFRPDAKYVTWLLAIARHAIIDKHRAEKRRPTQTLLTEPADATEADGIDQQQRDALAACLKELDEAAGSVVRERLAGNGYDEICGRLNLSAERAYKIFFQAKRRVQACLERKLS